jgi:hypothetical protein
MSVALSGALKALRRVEPRGISWEGISATSNECRPVLGALGSGPLGSCLVS